MAFSRLIYVLYPKVKMKYVILCSIFFTLSTYVLSTDLQILTNESVPTNYYHNGQLTGTSIDLVNAIKAELELTVDTQVLPWARAYNLAINTPNVVLFTTAKTTERVSLGFQFIGPIVTRQHALYKRSTDTFSVHSLKDIRKNKLVIGGLAGDWRAKYLADAGISIDYVTNYEQNVKKLLAGRIDMMIGSNIKMASLMKASGEKLSVIEQAYTIQEASSFIAFSPDTEQSLINEWSNAFKKISNSHYWQDSAEKWTKILLMPMGYSVEKGLYVIDDTQ